MNQFIFLYPIPEIIDFEIEKGARLYRNKAKEEEFIQSLKDAKSPDEENLIRADALNCVKSEFRTIYAEKLNACIDERYRVKGFNVSYVVFDNCQVSELIRIQKSDKVIKAGLEFKYGEEIFPNQDFILNQFEEMARLRVAGFHLDDCVDLLAKRAHEKGVDTLVDEDLTELFNGRLRDPDFKINIYPTYNPRKDLNPLFFEMFMKSRKGKPWLWQDY